MISCSTPRPTPIALAVCILFLGTGASARQAAETPANARPQQPASASASAAPAPVNQQPAAETKADPGIARVDIKGSADDYDPRREDTASKTVLTHEEIIKYGDTNVFDVLKRAPGVTVIGNSIRMRGLGNGYTQVLVNGERPPPGFSMDTLAPDQIDRIEVVRAATAEHSMQAIAGTINIVLKKVVSKPQRDLRINTGYSDQQKNLFLQGLLADRSGSLSYYLSAMAGRNLSDTINDSTEQFAAPSGQVMQLRDKHGLSQNNSSFLGLFPRLNWKLANDDQLNVSSFVQANRYGNASDTANTNRIGGFAQPDYTNRHSDTSGRWAFAGADVNWVAKLGGGKLDAKLSVSYSHSDTDTLSLSSTPDRAIRLQRDIGGTSHTGGYSTIGKYTRTLFEGHAMAAGWEASNSDTKDGNTRVEGILGTQPVHIDEAFNPVVNKLSAFVQDEWTVTKEWSVYQGVRWESIRTDSSGTGLRATRSRNNVWSPVAQTLYKFPDKSGRQLRMALTRTFKAPASNQLSARRYESDLNTRFNPDYGGNPDLKPELATGIDLTYEHFFAPGAVFSVGGSQRSIRDYIRSKLTQDASGYWLVQPLNDGSAQVRTLDVELKFPLKAFVKDAPGFDLRASVNRNWSKVDSVPGPDNRLDQQVRLSSVLGADYREDKYSAGASFSYRTGGPVRVSEQQTVQLQARRGLEAYWLYKIRTGLQVRLALGNALGQDDIGDSRYQDVNGTSRTWSRTPASARLQANLEMKF